MWPRLDYWLQIVLHCLNATAYLASSIILSGPFQWSAYQVLQTPRLLLKDQRCRKSVCSEEHSPSFSIELTDMCYVLLGALALAPSWKQSQTRSLIWGVSLLQLRVPSLIHSLLQTASISHQDVSFRQSMGRSWTQAMCWALLLPQWWRPDQAGLWCFSLRAAWWNHLGFKRF